MHFNVRTISLGNWQYSAGIGVDPRDDRYFNVIKQAYTYDPTCTFMRLWCPELSNVPDEFLLDPTKITAAIRTEYALESIGWPDFIVPLQHAHFDPEAMRKLSAKKMKKKKAHGGIPGLNMDLIP